MMETPMDRMTARDAIRSIPPAIWRLALAGVAALCCLLLPPVVAFQAQPLAGLGLVAIGALGALWPEWRPRGRWLHGVGATLLWGVVAWCALSQPALLTQPRSLIWSLRALPVLVGVALWLWSQLGQRWLDRALVAVTLPCLAALVLVAWSSPPRPLDFQPYYVVVDGQGTIYVSDAEAPVIRVFAPDGTLRAKLRPGLASRQGPPGLGFSPPGPYNDPDGLGVPRAPPGTGLVAGTLQPWPPGTDDFWFCGMAVGRHDRLYVPDWMRGRLLRFAPDGQLEARWALPDGYQPSLGCVATAGDALYLSDARGRILRLDVAGHVLAHWALPEPIVGGITASSDGKSVYALALQRVYRLDLRSGATTSWALPLPTGLLGRPYQGILALADGRVLIANLGLHREDIYTADGHPLGHWGSPGAWPGQFGQVGGLARDRDGRVYIADFDHRVLQRFTAAGRVDAVYWSPDDDEAE
jgi:hypothetical protein